ncbi:MAG: hypothetical protein K9N06_07560 [Candidatus Cloacimonetes bacterium]|nr:hypothetical protein [Candidatus Cloacimonadota bacterium]
MKLKEFINAVNAQFLTSEIETDMEISGGYASDLLSDVMGNAHEGQIWITIMRHLNVVAVASLANIAAVIFSNKMKPDEAVIKKANEEGIILLATNMTTFEVAGRLYQLLHP